LTLGVYVCVCGTQRAFCAYCSDRIWGLGRQGFKCINCKLLVHKKCHKLLKLSCGLVAVSRLMLLRQLSAWHCPHVLPSAVLRRLRFKPCAGLLCTLSSVCMYMCVCGASATEHWAAFDISCHSAANPQQREANDGTDRWTDGPLHRACMQPVASLSACLLDTTVSATEAAVPIEMPFGLWTRLGPRNDVLDGLPGLTRRS